MHYHKQTSITSLLTQKSTKYTAILNHITAADAISYTHPYLVWATATHVHHFSETSQNLSDSTLQSVHFIYLQDVVLLVLRCQYVEIGFLTQPANSVMITIQYLETAAQWTAQLRLGTCALLIMIWQLCETSHCAFQSVVMGLWFGLRSVTTIIQW